MFIHSNLSKMKNKILPICLQGNYRDSLGESSNTSFGLVGAARVKIDSCMTGNNAKFNTHISSATSEQGSRPKVRMFC